MSYKPTQEDERGLDWLKSGAVYVNEYAPHILKAVPRKCLVHPLRVHAVDIWNAYEISWLSEKKTPQVAVAKISVDGHSPNLVESKSLKLYLNSLNDTSFSSTTALKQLIEQDLARVAQSDVKVELELPPFKGVKQTKFDASWQCIDEDVLMPKMAAIAPEVLVKRSSKVVHEKLYSHLLKSNCLVTNQPDWATLMIEYQGDAWDYEGLLKYIVSYRHHQGFHEQCVENIFYDLATRLAPEKLLVQAFYTRRGGLDINPIRSSFQPDLDIGRTYQQ